MILYHRVLFINVALQRETKSCPPLCTACGTRPAKCLQCEHLHMQLVSLLLLFKTPLFKIFSCISKNTLKHWLALHLNMAPLHVSPDRWWDFDNRALRCIRARAPVLGRWTAYSVLCQFYACSPVPSTSFDPHVTETHISLSSVALRKHKRRFDHSFVVYCAQRQVPQIETVMMVSS